MCLLGGAVAGGICLSGRQLLFGSSPITSEAVAYTVLNRALLGFVIAVSSRRIHHCVHGALFGLVVSLSVSLGFLLSDPLGFAAYTLAGVLYGLLIEWFATDVFRAPMRIP